MKNFKRVLSLALAALMVIGGLVVAPVDAKAETYTRVTSVSEIAAGGEFVIVAKHSSGSYAYNGTCTNKWGQLNTVTLDANNNLTSTSAPTLVIEPGTAANQVYIKAGSNYTQGANANALYTTATKTDSLTQWLVSDDDADGEIQFKLVGSSDARSLVLNSNSGNPGFRAYKDSTATGSSSANYALELLVYKVGSGSSTPDPEPTPEPQPTAGTIAEALAGEANSLWAVKGVVTLVEGQNIYIQDAIGGICVRMSSEPTDIALGDTIEASGSKTVYNGTPQLGSGTYTKSTGLTLAPKTTTIGALTAADICTYVKITGLTVTEIFDNNGQYSNPNITVTDGTNEIQIYKAVVEKVDGEWSIKVGDKLDVLAAAGFYSKNGTEKFQLRNTLASEITVVVEEPDDSEDPSESESESESQAPSESESEKEELTAKDILAAANKLADGEYLGGSKDVKYTLKGVITKYEFNEQYGDASITIKVDGTDETFYCYQVKGEDVKNLKVGDHIELNGAIKNYKGTIEFERPNLVAILPTGDFSSVGTVMILIAGVACLAVAFTSKKKMA